MIGNIRDAYRFVLVAIIVLLVVCVAAAAVLLSPWGRSRASRQAEYDNVRARLMEKRREALPSRDMGQKLVSARQQIDTFYEDRLPTRYSTISETLGKLAAQNQVRINNTQYKSDDAPVAGLQRVDIDMSVTGDYAQEMRFVNAVERAKTFFVIDSVELGAAQGGEVQLKLKLQTYLKTGANAS
jgi:Tfp pilus assembly protein PilO